MDGLGDSETGADCVHCPRWYRRYLLAVPNCGDAAVITVWIIGGILLLICVVFAILSPNK